MGHLWEVAQSRSPHAPTLGGDRKGETENTSEGGSSAGPPGGVARGGFLWFGGKKTSKQTTPREEY